MTERNGATVSCGACAVERKNFSGRSSGRQVCRELSGSEGGQGFGHEIEAVQVMLDAHDDDALLARMRAGDEVAFRALVDRHRPWLVRLCTRLLGHDAHAAEDAAQESLLKLHAAARRDGRPLRVRPWLTVVARNTCVDEHRRRRLELPGELPERAAPGDDPFAFDAALAEAWGRLSGRHREVLYLREVLGFSYKEIGAVMDLTMSATETLVFRARAALRREYERSGGSSLGYGVLGFRLARLGLGRRRDVAVADGLSGAAANDGGLSGLGARLAQWMSTLPGCSEQAVAKVLSVAAGVVVAAASVIPGFGPFAATPPAAASVAAATAGSLAASPSFAAGDTATPSLKALLGNAVPADWAPHRRTGQAAAPSGGGTNTGPGAITPLRDAAAVARSGDRPVLNRPVRGDGGAERLRSVLPAAPDPVDTPERPEHPLRSLLTDAGTWPAGLLPIGPVPLDPLPLDPVPVDPVPVDPVPVEPPPATPAPAPDAPPSRKDAVDAAKDAAEPVRPPAGTTGGGLPPPGARPLR
jgi:RNA polymerase sigma factor (sigma-70 family)